MPNNRLIANIDILNEKTPEEISQFGGEAVLALRLAGVLEAIPPFRQFGRRVATARARQRRRGALNAMLDIDTLQRACALGAAEHRLIAATMGKLGLSARACHKALRVALTVADLDGFESVGTKQLSEALGYRRFDRPPAAPATA